MTSKGPAPAVGPFPEDGGQRVENLIDIKGVTHAYKTKHGPLPVLDNLNVAVREHVGLLAYDLTGR